MTYYIITAGDYALSNRSGTREWWWGNIDMFNMRMTYPVAREMLAAMQTAAANHAFPDDAVEWHASLSPVSSSVQQKPIGIEIYIIPHTFNTENYAKIGGIL